MLGSDPIAALLGAGTDPRCSPTVWKVYLRKLVDAGASVTMLGPDVVVPDDASDEVKVALNALINTYPTGTQMPEETTGALADFGVVDAEASRVNNRVGTYYRHIHRVVGKELAPDLLASGVITASAGLHVGSSGMVAVTAHNPSEQEQWRSWAADLSGDRRERHTAPTILPPTADGGGIYLFRTNVATSVPKGVSINKGFLIETGDVVVPIPPTRMGGSPVMRLGPARMLPPWLRSAILEAAGTDIDVELAPIPELAGAFSG